jgi:hypothetical protein
MQAILRRQRSDFIVTQFSRRSKSSHNLNLVLGRYVPFATDTVSPSFDNNNSNNTKMKFSSALFTALAVPAVTTTTAWAPASVAAVSRPAIFGSQTALFSAVVSYTTEQIGEVATESFRLKFKEGDDVVSPWHDIPLEGSTPGSYNMVVEIPKMTTAKMEVATKEESNPIAQDEKKGKLRDYHGPIFWNYGTFFHVLLFVFDDFVGLFVGRFFFPFLNFRIFFEPFLNLNSVFLLLLFLLFVVLFSSHPRL